MATPEALQYLGVIATVTQQARSGKVYTRVWPHVLVNCLMPVAVLQWSMRGRQSQLHVSTSL